MGLLIDDIKNQSSREIKMNPRKCPRIFRNLDTNDRIWLGSYQVILISTMVYVILMIFISSLVCIKLGVGIEN